MILNQRVNGLDARQSGDPAQLRGIDMRGNAVVDALRAVEHLRAKLGQRRQQALLGLIDARKLRAGGLHRLRCKCAGLGLRVGLCAGRTLQLDYDTDIAMLPAQCVIDRCGGVGILGRRYVAWLADVWLMGVIWELAMGRA